MALSDRLSNIRRFVSGRSVITAEDMNTIVDMLLSLSNITGVDAAISESGVNLRPPTDSYDLEIMARLKKKRHREPEPGLHLTEYAWEQITRKVDETDHGLLVESGLTSTVQGDEFAIPAVNLPELAKAEGGQIVPGLLVPDNSSTQPIVRMTLRVRGDGRMRPHFNYLAPATDVVPVILRSFAVESPNRWGYLWDESYTEGNDQSSSFGKRVVLPGGRVSEDYDPPLLARNHQENSNDGADPEGYGLTLSHTHGSLIMGPLSNQAAVYLHIEQDSEGDPVAWFQAPNPLAAVCNQSVAT